MKIHAVLVSSLFLYSCGGGDDDVSTTFEELSGTWLISSMSATVGEDSVTLLRSETGEGVRGDVVISGTEFMGQAKTRSVLLDENVPVSDIDTATNTVVLENDKLLSTNDDGITVFDMTLTASTLTLDLAPEDERTTDQNPFDQIVMDRLETPWSDQFSNKNYSVLSLAFANNPTVTNGECLEVPTDQGTFWTIPDFSMSCDSDMICNQVFDIEVFSDAGCMTALGTDTFNVNRLTESVDGNVQFWDSDGTDSQYTSYDVSETAGVLTLTLTDCAPTDICVNAATTVTLELQ